MAAKTKTTLFLCLLSLLSCSEGRPNAGDIPRETTINGMFVFGSSLVDNGNNNFLPISRAKANFLPYGQDFPLGPSGRFTNGRNVIDVIGQLLNLPSFIPPFLDPSTKGNNIVHGVNFASGASGILDDTGLVAVQVMSLNKQIKNFEEVTLPDLEAQLGCKREEALANYLIVLGTGGNDYSFNYFLTGRLHPNLTPQDFTSTLISAFSAQIKKLYDLGGRKFVIMSVNPLGCYPVVLARQPADSVGCNEAQNQAAELFNTNVRTLIDKLKQDMPGSNLVFVDSYNILKQIIDNPLPAGFVDATKPCCEVTTLVEGGNGSLCRKGGLTCANRTSHVFFDGLHPTDAVNVVIATRAFSSQDYQTDVYPMNINQLAQL